MQGACLLDPLPPKRRPENLQHQQLLWPVAVLSWDSPVIRIIWRYPNHQVLPHGAVISKEVQSGVEFAKWSSVHIPCRNTLNTPRLMAFPKHTVLTSNSSCRCLSLSRASCISSCFAVLSEANFLAPCIRLSPVTNLFQHGRASTLQGNSLGDILLSSGPNRVSAHFPISPSILVEVLSTWCHFKICSHQLPEVHVAAIFYLYLAAHPCPYRTGLPALKSHKGRQIRQNLCFHPAQVSLQLLLHTLDGRLLKCFSLVARLELKTKTPIKRILVSPLTHHILVGHTVAPVFPVAAPLATSRLATQGRIARSCNLAGGRPCRSFCNLAFNSTMLWWWWLVRSANASANKSLRGLMVGWTGSKESSNHPYVRSVQNPQTISSDSRPLPFSSANASPTQWLGLWLPRWHVQWLALPQSFRGASTKRLRILPSARSSATAASISGNGQLWLIRSWWILITPHVCVI